MTVKFGFYDSVNGDRKYNAAQFSSLFDGIINDGVFASIGTSLIVQAATGMQVNVGVGRAWFNKTWIDNDTLYPLTLDASEVVGDRIDAVVVEVNTDVSVRENTIKIVKGTPSATPSNPTLTNTETIHQHPLCYVLVKAGVTTITQQDITNLVGTPACPFITGLLQTMTVEGITLLLEEQFDIWFASIQNKLDGDTAGHLLNMIEKSSYLQDSEPINSPEPHSIWFDVQ